MPKLESLEDAAAESLDECAHLLSTIGRRIVIGDLTPTAYFLECVKEVRTACYDVERKSNIQIMESKKLCYNPLHHDGKYCNDCDNLTAAFDGSGYMCAITLKRII